MIAGAVCGVFLASCASAPSVSSGPWRDCVVAAARRLAPSTGSAAEIAEAALGLCGDEEQAFKAGATRIVATAPYGIVPSIRAENRQLAIAAVLTARGAHR
jgi:hypothetical protein